MPCAVRLWSSHWLGPAYERWHLPMLWLLLLMAISCLLSPGACACAGQPRCAVQRDHSLALPWHGTAPKFAYTMGSLLLLVVFGVLRHVHVLASQDVLCSETVFLIRHGLVLCMRQDLLWSQSL